MIDQAKLPITFFFQKLSKVSTLRISCVNDEACTATATVSVQLIDRDKIVYNEVGIWEESKISFHNTVRWTLSENLLKLEHLRLGGNNPIHLCDFIPLNENEMKSCASHHCGEDDYHSKLFFNTNQVLLYWKISGPRKNTDLLFQYN